MIKKIAKYVGIIILIALCIGIYMILSMDERTSDEELSKIFNKRKVPIEIIYDNDVRYVKASASTKTNNHVLFIHGAPGSGGNYHGYLMDSTLRSTAHTITMDRHGYDRSQYGTPELSIAKQAEDIAHMIKGHIDTTEQVTIVSHSYGGPVGAYVCYLLPNRIQSHIMLCPVLDPVSEPMFWYAGAPLWWPLKYLSSPFMKVATYEKLSHPDQLNAVAHIWSKVAAPTLMIQGAKDWLAPVANADYVRAHFNPKSTEVRVLPEESHFIPFSKSGYVIDLISEMLQKKGSKTQFLEQG